VEKVLTLYGSPLAGQDLGVTLIDVFNSRGLNPWIGLALMKQESSFANPANNPNLDERNTANPFGAHFKDPKMFPGCARESLLIPDDQAEFKGIAHPKCSIKGYRLPTFRESAEQAAKILKNKGYKGYNPRATYKGEVSSNLRDILNKLAEANSKKQ